MDDSDSSDGGDFNARQSNESARVAALIQSLRDAQLEIEGLKETIRDQKEQLLIKTSTRHQSTSKTANQTTAAETDADPTKERPIYWRAVDLGRKYVVLCHAWAERDWIRALTPTRPVIDLKDYAAQAADPVLAHQAEAWDYFAPDSELVALLGTHADLLAGFMHGTQDRSKFVHAATSNVHYIFADLNLPNTSIDSAADRKACAELQRLLPSTPNKAFCDVLFPPDHINDGAWLFKSKRMLVIIQCGIFGKNAPKGKSATNRLSKAYKWGLTSVTPALIALAATVLVYITAGDNVFIPRSDGNNIVQYPYQQFFDTYLDLLWRLYNPGTVNLIKWYNSQLFDQQNTTASSATNATSDDDDDEAAAHMRMLEATFGQVTVATSSSDPAGPRSQSASKARASRDSTATTASGFLSYVSPPSASASGSQQTSASAEVAARTSELTSRMPPEPTSTRSSTDDIVLEKDMPAKPPTGVQP
ncbi:hypothetical protein BDW22DRAFT_1432985 [Trametopsis cervina]|nr:hypothetical protein BDW22DRAFT_1432985 [Trametopsis cervina]